MSKNNRRLGRGLDSLISGGLNKPTPPAVKIDNTKIQPKKADPKKIAKTQADTPKPKGISKKSKNAPKKAARQKPSADELKQSQKKELLDDLNHLLRKTQQEAEAENGGLDPADSWKNSEDAADVEANKPAAQGESTEVAGAQFVSVPLKKVVVSPFQRRKTFNAEALADLEASIRSEGLLQPVVVREVDGSYELVAGERRFRACSNLQMEFIPARIVKAEDESAAVMGLIENLQRENLNPVEEARGYGMLLTDFKMTQEGIAQATGKARATIANSLRLLLLEAEILGYLSKGQLSTGHAKVLLGLPEGSQRLLLARKVIEEGLSVRATEAMIRKVNASHDTTQKPRRIANEQEIAAIESLQKDLTSRFNAKVTLQHSSKGGRMIIQYRSNDELDAIIRKMGLNS